MNQLSLFDNDEIQTRIYEMMSFKGLVYDIEKYQLIKMYEGYGFSCYVKTTCGKLLQLFISMTQKELHQIIAIFEKLRDQYIEKQLAKIEVEYM